MWLENKRRRPDTGAWASPARRVLLAASTLAAVAAIVAAIVASAKSAHAQGTIDRGAFVIHNGNDTVVVNRFVRSADSLQGSVFIRGQGRVEYALALGKRNSIFTLRLKIYNPGATTADAPAQTVSTLMNGDTAYIGTHGAIRPVATKAGAVPSFNNAIAISEIFTRRAQETHGSGDYWYISMAAGVTVPATVRPLPGDSLLLTIAGQKERLRVDAAGRILGGTIEGQPYVISRATEAEAAKIGFDRVPAKPGGKPGR